MTIAIYATISIIIYFTGLIYCLYNENFYDSTALCTNDKEHLFTLSIITAFMGALWPVTLMIGVAFCIPIYAMKIINVFKRRTNK